jgi:hypothetical protein
MSYYSENREARLAYQRAYSQTPAGRAAEARKHQNRKERYPERIKARKDVAHAIEAKRLLRASEHPCDICGDDAESYHHLLGYEPGHELDLIPLCAGCHRKEDRA